MADTPSTHRLLYIITRAPEEDAPALFVTDGARDTISVLVTDPAFIPPQFSERNIFLLENESGGTGIPSAHPHVSSEEVIEMIFAADHVVVV
jgi:hypothetical protein